MIGDKGLRFPIGERSFLCIDWDERSLRVVDASMSRSDVRIRRAVNVPLAQGTNVRDPVSMGDFKLEGRNTIVPNLRHKLALEQCIEAVSSAVNGLEASLPVELIGIELSEAIDRLGEIIGLSVKKDVLDQIFSRFCIGK